VSTSRPFAQVDVFSSTPFRGNPVAVVLDGEGLKTDQMQAFAAWTNLSETTFVLPPTQPGADYRLRIFTPGGELPFAGHPTLGSAHAWLEAGGTPAQSDVLVQECKAGLIELRRAAGPEPALSFQSPPLVRTGPVEEELLDRIAAALRIERSAIVAHQWVDNGPGWAAVRLATAQEVLDLEPDDSLMRHVVVGVVGAYPDGARQHVEVRAFALPFGIREDPVTGSLNGGLARWLVDDGVVPSSYSASQGTRLSRSGVVTLEVAADGVWVGGTTATLIRGTVEL
jgi:PhzF family phenazine biosynthesis protein